MNLLTTLEKPLFLRRVSNFGHGHLLAVVVVLTHLSLLTTPFYFHWNYLLLSVFIYFLMGGVGSSVTMHRYLSHRSWNCPRWFEYAGSIFTTLGLVGSTITWVAIHRSHHMHTDTPKDPHSPYYQHWLRVHFSSMYCEPQLRLAIDLVEDPLHRFLHRYYWLVNLAYFSTLFYLGGWNLALWAHIVPALMLWHGGSSINSIGHMVGTNSNSTKDQSRNNFFLALIMWGEGWHNNHHRYPKRAIFQIKWYEIDMGGLLVKIFSRP